METIRQLVDYGIIGGLFVMSIIAVGIAIERFSFIKGLDLKGIKGIDELEVLLTRRLYLIASIGSNAPYIGLLGTVLGIMLTFYEMGQGTGMDVRTIMVGLSLALKATAMGLLVAIPCVFLYNALLRRVREKMAVYKLLNRSGDGA
jgi:biopolymer transport protein ExbB